MINFAKYITDTGKPVYNGRIEKDPRDNYICPSCTHIQQRHDEDDGCTDYYCAYYGRLCGETDTDDCNYARDDINLDNIEWDIEIDEYKRIMNP